jgi:hypothetical protein
VCHLTYCKIKVSLFFKTLRIFELFLFFYIPFGLVKLSAATLVAADYGFTCPPRFMSVVCCWTDKNCNFSAVRSPIELKLGGDLRLVSQISLHVLVFKIQLFFIL